MPAGNAPSFSGSLDLTPDVLNAMKKAGTNANGNYKLRFALWDNDKRDKDTAPHFKGLVTVPEMNDSPKAYASMWNNDGKGGGQGGSKPVANDDPF